MPGDGVPIKWHRDASMESVDSTPAIDVGFYLGDTFLPTFFVSRRNCLMVIMIDNATVEMGNCLWAIPGTHKWPDMIASQMIDHLTNDGAFSPAVGPSKDLFLFHLFPFKSFVFMKLFLTELFRPGFKTSGAVPVEVGPGDVILHNILVLHGSKPSKSPKLRRTVYFEYRAIAQELKMGPHVPEYIPLKQSAHL